MYWLFCDTDVAFRSSDGRWAGEEWNGKGIHFKGVVNTFEYYKLVCGASTATLVRTTPKHWYNVFGWPSYLRSEPKWSVPYGAPSISTRVGEQVVRECEKSTGRVDPKRAYENARLYIERLKNDGA
jgi:hypothetical protein